MRGLGKSLPATIARLERLGLPLREALRMALLDGALSHWERAAAGKLLAISAKEMVAQSLLRLFFEESGKDELYWTALTLEELNDR
jgi:hypothetical protein